MEPIELLEALLELAAEVDVDVRVLRRASPSEADFTPNSACCRVKGKFWVVLSPNDPVELHVRVLASALKSEAGPRLEARYLPPAVREALDATSDANPFPR